MLHHPVRATVVRFVSAGSDCKHKNLSVKKPVAKIHEIFIRHDAAHCRNLRHGNSSFWLRGAWHKLQACLSS